MGYSKDLFLDKEGAESYSCDICLDVLQDPTQVMCKEDHVFCKACLETYIRHAMMRMVTCPNCREQVDHRMLRGSNFVKRQVNALRWKCSNHASGCNWEGEVGSRHQDSCPYVLESCPLRCGAKYLARERDSHRSQCPNEIIPCPRCPSIIDGRALRESERCRAYHRHQGPDHEQICRYHPCEFARAGCPYRSTKENVSAHETSYCRRIHNKIESLRNLLNAYISRSHREEPQPNSKGKEKLIPAEGDSVDVEDATEEDDEVVPVDSSGDKKVDVKGKGELKEEPNDECDIAAALDIEADEMRILGALEAYAEEADGGQRTVANSSSDAARAEPSRAPSAGPSATHGRVDTQGNTNGSWLANRAPTTNEDEVVALVFGASPSPSILSRPDMEGQPSEPSAAGDRSDTSQLPVGEILAGSSNVRQGAGSSTPRDSASSSRANAGPSNADLPRMEVDNEDDFVPLQRAPPSPLSSPSSNLDDPWDDILDLRPRMRRIREGIQSMRTSAEIRAELRELRAQRANIRTRAMRQDPSDAPARGGADDFAEGSEDDVIGILNAGSSGSAIRSRTAGQQRQPNEANAAAGPSAAGSSATNAADTPEAAAASGGAKLIAGSSSPLIDRITPFCLRDRQRIGTGLLDRLEPEPELDLGFSSRHRLALPRRSLDGSRTNTAGSSTTGRRSMPSQLEPPRRLYDDPAVPLIGPGRLPKKVHFLDRRGEEPSTSSSSKRMRLEGEQTEASTPSLDRAGEARFASQMHALWSGQPATPRIVPPAAGPSRIRGRASASRNSTRATVEGSRSAPTSSRDALNLPKFKLHDRLPPALHSRESDLPPPRRVPVRFGPSEEGPAIVLDTPGPSNGQQQQPAGGNVGSGQPRRQEPAAGQERQGAGGQPAANNAGPNNNNAPRPTGGENVDAGSKRARAIILFDDDEAPASPPPPFSLRGGGV